MRILMWTSFLRSTYGGLETFLQLLVPRLAALGHEIVIADEEWEADVEEEYQPGVRIVRLPRPETGGAGMLTALSEGVHRVERLLAEFDPDLVHVCKACPSLFYLLRGGERRHPPLLFNLHGAHVAPLADPQTLGGRLLRSADWIVACSKATLEHLIDLAPEIRPRASVVYNGMPAPPGPVEVPAPFPPRLVCVGRLHAEKGFDVALAAADRLAGRWPDLEVVVAGEGPARHELEAIARLGRLADRVSFPGWVAPDDVHALLAGAAVVPVPSIHEGFGLVALEAALAARPVVASRVEGIPEVVLDGETGLLVPPGDAEALARAIGGLLEDPGRGTALGARARELAIERFGVERCVEGYIEVYERIAR
ncbi:MAG: glycosyltransferase family 4 protein [Gemmatimonadota bacterium]